jgi:hypothetical protein
MFRASLCPSSGEQEQDWLKLHVKMPGCVEPRLHTTTASTMAFDKTNVILQDQDDPVPDSLRKVNECFRSVQNEAFLKAERIRTSRRALFLTDIFR